EGGGNKGSPPRRPCIGGGAVPPPRRDQKPVGVDLALGRALFAADRGDAAVGDRNFAGKRGLAGAVDDGAAANDDIVHGRRSLDPPLAWVRILKFTRTLCA